MHVITNFTASAGAETMLARLLRVSQGERIVVAPLMDVSDRNRLLAANPAVDFCPLGARSMAGMAASVLTLSKLIRAERPDAILCWMYHGMVVGILAGRLAGLRTPVFWAVRQSLDDLGSLSASIRTALAISRRLSRLPAGIAFNSERALAQHLTYGYRNENCIVIPNGFDPVETAPRAAAAPTVFGIAARLSPQKDYPNFFAAAAETHRTHPTARFVAAGARLTSDNPAVARMLAEAGLPPEAVDLRGEVSDMGQVYGDIDALVLSSRTEGFPNVVAEAMSYGRPVICTDVGDASAIVADTGFVVPPADPLALARAMRQMLDLTPQDYARLAIAAKHRIDATYGISRIARQYDDFLSSAPK